MAQPPSFLERLFGKSGFAWSFRMRSGNARDFFAPSVDGDRILTHKRKALAEHPSRYLGELEGAGHLLDQLVEQLREWEVLPARTKEGDDLRSISLQLEPDILLVDGHSLDFVAASVCMPSSWSLAHTLGKPVHVVHQSVPRLNPSIGPQIERFLKSLPEGKSFCRENWSITLSEELDYHPDLNRPKPTATTPPDELYLRLEHQLFTPIRDGILMGIRIEPVPFSELRKDPVAWVNLAEILHTMPDDVADYKGMRHYRDALAAQMREAGKTRLS